MRVEQRPNAIQRNGVAIVRTPKGIAVGPMRNGPWPEGPWTVEVYYLGRLLKTETINPAFGDWRDYFGETVNHLACSIFVKSGETLLAQLDLPAEEFVDPFMVRHGFPQQHVTESYVSVPPALTITDEVGAVWTLGFIKAPRENSPDGEYAFAVLRDAIPTGDIASRIERRGGKVRIFTRHGWKQWTGRSFF